MQLYELAASDGRLFSPPCWRSRLVLEWHKLKFTSVPTSYTAIKKVAEGQFTTLPIFQDGEKMMADSWEINKHLASATGKEIFRTPTEEAQALFVQQLVLIPRTLRMVIMALFNAVVEEDRDYFRASREERFSMPLEEAQLTAEESMAELLSSYQGFENYFSQHSLLGGDRIGYADITLLSHLQLPIQMGGLDLLAKMPAMSNWAKQCARQLPSVNIWL